MEVKIIEIGNSQGIIIPSSVLKLLDFRKKLKITVQEDQVILSKVDEPRKGWKEMIQKEIELNGQPEKLIPDFFDDENLSDWTW